MTSDFFDISKKITCSDGLVETYWDGVGPR
jgi:hypothetical protein